MKTDKLYLWIIVLLLAILLLGEAFIRYFIPTRAMPYWFYFRFAVYYHHYGLGVRFVSFSLLWALFYSARKKSLIDRFNQNTVFVLSKNQQNYVIFGYILACFMGLLVIRLPYYALTLGVYVGVFATGFLFSYFPEATKEKVKTDRKKQSTPYSLNLKGENNRWLNITNPFRGVLGIGSAGSGKTTSMAEPFIEQFAQKNFAGIIYDFKFPTLSEVAYLHFSQKRKLPEGAMQPTFYVVNFTDISKSHRFNPLNPNYLESQNYAAEFAKALIANFNTDSNQNSQQRDFWTKSATAFLTAIIWYLKKNEPAFCTIPHVVQLIVGHSYKDLLKLLESDADCVKIIQSILTARDEKAGNQLSGVVSTLQIDFATLTDERLSYILSGDDFDLNINDPKNPKVICVATDNNLAATLSPIVSLIFSVALKKMNEQGKHHAFCLLDEAAQINIPTLPNVVATCRSNQVSVVFLAQNLSQMEDKYGKTEAKTILANLNYQIFGRTSVYETAEYVSKMVGDATLIAKSENQNFSPKHTSTGDNFSETEKRAIKPQEVINLQSGEVVGIRPIEPSDLKRGTTSPTFKLKVKREIFQTIIAKNGVNQNGQYSVDGAFRSFGKEIPCFNKEVEGKRTMEKKINKQIAEDCRKILNLE